MRGKHFHVDTDELHRIGKALHDACDDLNEQRNLMPSEPADAGISTEITTGAVCALLGGVSELLGDLDGLLEALQATRSDYLLAEDQARQSMWDVPNPDSLFLLRTNNKETGAPWWTR